MALRVFTCRRFLEAEYIHWTSVKLYTHSARRLKPTQITNTITTVRALLCTISEPP